MLSSRYSRPEFDPYGSEDTPPEHENLWRAPVASSPVTGTVVIPGSKSLTNRELVLSALADGPSLLKQPLHSRDTLLMLEALQSLGVGVEKVENTEARGTDWLIAPHELTGSTTIDCGLAGTVMRFLPPVAALALGPTTFDGDEGARRRPMFATIKALKDLGVDIADEGRGTLPFTVHGTGQVAGGDVNINASQSSQFVSGLLLSAARFDNGINLRHSGEKLPSLPHIEMTIEVLENRGVKVLQPEPGHWIIEPGVIHAKDIEIEPDLSNAAPFLAAALVTGGTVTIPHWPQHTTQVGNDLLEILPKFGAEVSRDNDKVTVTGKQGADGVPLIHGIEIDLSTGGELAPSIVAIAALASTPSTITGIGHIRHHETDRLAALANEINNLGGKVTELEDGLLIEPAPLTSGVWSTYHDHRMATAGAIIGLRVEGIVIENIGTTSKTLPEFPSMWLELVESASL